MAKQEEPVRTKAGAGNRGKAAASGQTPGKGQKVVSLVAEEPRTVQDAPRAVATAKRPRKGKPDLLFMVETEPGSAKFEIRNLPSTAELLELVDRNQRVIVTRKWREF